jgi:PEGA domain/Tetratricopeptide repeat
VRKLSGSRFGLISALLLSSSIASNAFAQAPSEVTAAVEPAPSASASTESAPSAEARVAPAPVAAEPRPLAESLDGDAKREYENGRLLYENGDYAGALVRFEHARKASNDARLLWNAAVCQKALHHYAKAIALMRGYLASSWAASSPIAAASAQNFVAAAERLTARLEVSSNVLGALVYADGDRLGQAPLGAEARVDWGTHQIVLKKADYTDYEQTVTVSSAADVRVVAVLRPVVHEGRIIVRASSGDLIAIDGAARAWGTWEGVLSSGAHALRISAAGFRPREQQIVVADAQTRGFDVTLARAPRSSLPTWVWLVGGTVLAAGVATAGYFIFKPGDANKPTDGSIATVRLDLR